MPEHQPQPARHASHPAPAAPAPAGATPAAPSVPLPSAPAASAPALCGKPHQYKTKAGETRTKPCVRAKGHAGSEDGSKCSSRNAPTRVDTKVLAGFALSAEEVPGEEILDIVTERTRSAEQQQVDKDVAAAHKKWIAAGRKPGFNDNIKAGAASRYTVPPTHAAAVRTLLRRSETANPGVHVRIAPPKKHVNGGVMIYFLAVDKSTARSEAKKGSNTPAATK